MWFSPAELIIPTHVLYLLRSIYPEVNWEKVKFHNGLPWFTSTFSSWTSAIVLPSTFGCSKISVYFKNFDPDSCAGLSIIVHEGFHVRSEEHTSELQSRPHLVCRLLLEK